MQILIFLIKKLRISTPMLASPDTLRNQFCERRVEVRGIIFRAFRSIFRTELLITLLFLFFITILLIFCTFRCFQVVRFLSLKTLDYFLRKSSFLFHFELQMRPFQYFAPCKSDIVVVISTCFFL